ncbi:MAG: hypothetical protein UV78_C0001G0015 [Parcubacteria group bacterium GW2011_GWA2_43_17]|nr:MAG: hypothetical protein UV78_C0001G0015 [Parcubacteria group bacterium GW2011_GWA2_43_17]KKT91170.1 MAG: hypothetical protein UW91_C0037G0008 [Parcubacteria group bacterium GW2011_GWF2_45_11]OHB45256.1 MAG: sugar ABC transporter substrate-binding protein [Planctomycetes bacterium GWC2_45_44]HBR20558.1 sugar ABC transporter substrate-binding protein [Phycisphaerales bacterium]
MKSKLLFLSIVICLLICIQSCAKKNGTAEKKRLTIAVIPKGTIHEFWKSVNAGAAKAASELDVDIIWKGPLKEDDRESQITVVENLVNRGVSGIVLAPLDDTALRIPVANARWAGIPVVIFDSGLKGEDFISYVATDNFEGGRIAGKYMADILGGKGKVIVLRYTEGSDSTTQRENGFLATIADFNGIEVVSSNQYAGVTTESAITAAENLLSRFRTAEGDIKVDGIFCATEPTTLGIIKAMEGLDMLGKVKLVGFDSSNKMVDALQKGNLSGFVVQNPMEIGYLGVKTMVSHLRGQKVEHRIDTGATLITTANINEEKIQQLLKPDLEKWLK